MCGQGEDGEGALLAWSCSVWPKGPPSVFPLPWSRSQGVLGCVSRAINFSSILKMTFGGICMLSLGGVGSLHDPETCHWLVHAEGISIGTGH